MEIQSGNQYIGNIDKVGKLSKWSWCTVLRTVYLQTFSDTWTLLRNLIQKFDKIELALQLRLDMCDWPIFSTVPLFKFMSVRTYKEAEWFHDQWKLWYA